VFRSRRRAVVYPQAEHARVAATLAASWGNDAFGRPRLPFDAFVHGVALHDRGYGELDADGIGEVPLERWLEIQRRSFEPRGDDAVVDVVVALHVRRLVSWSRDEAARRTLAAFDEALPVLIAAGGLDAEAAADADRVTDLCDRISFDLCVEEATDGSVEVRPHAGDGLAGVRYELDGEGTGAVEPWPFGVPWIAVVATGFVADGYPTTLEPVATIFRLERGGELG
jgi:hypothetical protein